MYEVESYKDKVKSVTDGPVTWAKRSRQSDDPVPVQSLLIKTAKYVTEYYYSWLNIVNIIIKITRYVC